MSGRALLEWCSQGITTSLAGTLDACGTITHRARLRGLVGDSTD